MSALFTDTFDSDVVPDVSFEIQKIHEKGTAGDEDRTLVCENCQKEFLHRNTNFTTNRVHVICLIY